MRVFKIILIITGTVLTLGLFIYGNIESSKVKAQRETIEMIERNSTIDSVVLREYKDNFKVLKRRSDCKSTIDSMINNSEYIKY